MNRNYTVSTSDRLLRIEELFCSMLVAMLILMLCGESSVAMSVIVVLSFTGLIITICIFNWNHGKYMKAITGKEKLMGRKLNVKEFKLIHSPFISEYDYLKMNDLLPREEV